MTTFSIIIFFDPYGDMKSNRKQLSRTNYQSTKDIAEITGIIDNYNGGNYYNAVKVADFDKRSKKILDFDKSFYLTSKAQSARYESIPGY